VSAIVGGAIVAFEHAASAFMRRRRTYVAAALIILPAFLPLIVSVLPHEHDHDFEASRAWVMTQMIEIFYILGVTPLLALFFAAMLVGEDVEMQTISYVLTRSVSRSAWVVGRFAAYLALTSGIILISIASLSLTVFSIPNGGESLGIATLARYQLTATLALMGYGAFCAFLGALVRHPVVVGVLLIFGWQQIALLAPGATNFLTISKYVTSLLPEGSPGVRRMLGDVTSELLNPTLMVSPLTAGIVLLTLSAVCLALATAVVRAKEYTTPVAVTE
jgi:ABC-type transport system involved in multi-copper enzyme maturation permease subunit